MRQVERTVMLRIIDQRWRSHLYEMDYLREGINLRAMGQRDPLTEWQREGFDMFGQMMHGVWRDFIRFVMRVQVQVNKPQTPLQPGERPQLPGSAPADAAPADADSDAQAEVADALPTVDDAPAVKNMQYSAPEDPSSGTSRMAAAAAAGPADGGAAAGANGGGANGAKDELVNTPTVKTDWDKTPRNAPCPCGSGKKYKLCHGG
jgi:preprotein translocase subunit SecA